MVYFDESRGVETKITSDAKSLVSVSDHAVFVPEMQDFIYTGLRNNMI